METEIRTEQAILAAEPTLEQQPTEEQPEESTTEEAQAISPEQLPVPAATFLILEDAVAKGEPLPSIRGIRARIGRGSLGTISDAVKTWKQDRLTRERYIPRGFQDDEAKKIVEFVWSIVQPALMREIGEGERLAQERIDIERSEVAKLREAAEDILAAGEKKDECIVQLEARIKELQSKVDALQGALDEARAQLAEEKEARTTADAEKVQALQEAASATAELQSMKKLLPLLDPTQLDKLSKPTSDPKADADPTDADPKRESQVVKPATPAEPKAAPKGRSKSSKAKQQPLVPDGGSSVQ